MISAIMGGVQMLGNVVSGIIKNNAAKREAIRQNIASNKQAAINEAQSYNDAYAYDNERNQILQNIAFKLGGRRRKRCQNGTKLDITGQEIPATSSEFNTVDVITAGTDMVDSIVSNIMDTKTNPKTVVSNRIGLSGNKALIIPEYVDRQLPMLKCGGKRRR